MATIVLVAAASSGRLALDPQASLDAADPVVFESASSSGSRAGGQVATDVALASNATTDAGVTGLNVIDDGRSIRPSSTLAGRAPRRSGR
ncbi:hypothetical protein BRC98_03325 [Halobacteriales archaeon QS_7_68_65]|nr:MAG: hypothetical protein BRC98_03325 [Halobacteriales archaeon QS_7_68_65]